MIDLLNKHGLNGHYAQTHFDGGVTAALISAAATTAAAGTSAAMGGKMNKRAQREAWRARDFQRQEREAQQAWQLQMYNRGLADQQMLRDYDNAYNSPAAQAQRMQEAGFSPLATLGQMDNTSSSLDLNGAPSAPSDPSAAMPNFNPVGLDAASIQAGFNAFSERILQEKKQRAEISKLDEESNAIKLEQMRKGLMFGKEFEFMGVQIDLSKAQKGLTTQQAAKTAQEALEAENNVKLIKQYVAESGARITKMDVDKACAVARLDQDARRLMQDIWLSQKQGWNIRQDTLNKYQEGENLKYQGYGQYWQGQEQKRQYKYNTKWEYSEPSIAVQKGMNVVSSIIKPVSEASQILMNFSIGGLRNAQAAQMLQSSRNPIGFGH